MNTIFTSTIIRFTLFLVVGFLMRAVHGEDVSQKQLADTPYVKIPHKTLSISCEACHTPDSWKTLKPSIEFDHKSTGFALNGAHRMLQCAQCHANGRFSNTVRECSACHREPHLGQLGLDCRRCHTETAWAPSVYVHDDQTILMRGAHRALDCGECHKDLRTFKMPNIHECSDCHKVPSDQVHRGYQGFGDCRACHNLESWNDYPHYDGWLPLIGHHRVSCEQCHPQAPANYKTTDCSSCHRSGTPR